MIKAMKFASIPVTDQQRALEFYTRKLGFHVTTDQAMGPGQRWIELGLNGGSGVALFTPPEHQDRIGTFSGISFVCDDVEKTHRELAERGVEFMQPPKKESWGTSAIFKDVDGNAFVLSSK
jgi:predicted enzyme related to lactoylglutathione lyase